jgi:hypothetical protein
MALARVMGAITTLFLSSSEPSLYLLNNLLVDI